MSRADVFFKDRKGDYLPVLRFRFQDNDIPLGPGNEEAVALPEPQKQFPILKALRSLVKLLNLDTLPVSVLDTARIHKYRKGLIRFYVGELGKY